MAYDSEAEINLGVTEVLKTLGSVEDEEVSIEELSDHMNDLSAVMTVNDVAMWIEHSVLLPQLSDRFRAHGVSSMDFPVLIENDGLALETDLGITSKLHRAKIVRAIKMKLLGIAKRKLCV